MTLRSAILVVALLVLGLIVQWLWGLLALVGVTAVVWLAELGIRRRRRQPTG